MAFTAGVLQAAVIVLSSNASSIRNGQELADDKVIKLQSGDKISVLLPNDAVKEISGPFEGTVKDIGGGSGSVGSRLWLMVKDFFITGGVDQSQSGGTRSVQLPVAQSNQGPGIQVDKVPGTTLEKALRDWRAIPLQAPAIVCVDSGELGNLRFYRDKNESSLKAKLSDETIEQTGSLDFGGNQSEAGWPKSVKAENGKTYVLTLPGGQKPRNFKLKALSASQMADDVILENLVREACDSQVKLWLQIKSASR
jgi:hypothetical protein